jgi:hypothetical protein
MLPADEAQADVSIPAHALHFAEHLCYPAACVTRTLSYDVVVPLGVILKPFQPAHHLCALR